MIIVNDQDGLAAALHRPSLMQNPARSSNLRQPNLEKTALAQLAPNVDRSAMVPHDLPDCRETKPISAQAGREEWLEQSIERLGIHAATGISHTDANITPRNKTAMAQLSSDQHPMDLRRYFRRARAIHGLGRVVA